jgi:UDPglucose 6-dehydrogenase
MFVSNGYSVTVFDPVAVEATRQLLGNMVCYSPSLRDAVKQADAVLIMLPYDEFRPIDPSFLASSETIVMDCWRVLERRKFDAAPNYLALGVGSQAAASSRDQGLVRTKALEGVSR